MKRQNFFPAVVTTYLTLILMLVPLAPVSASEVPLDNAAKQLSQSLVSKALNINTASEQQLIELPGVGKRKASAIIAYREQHGQFKSIEELKKVEGIGEKTYLKLKDKIQIK